MPDIYLLIEGQQQGPYTDEQIRQSLSDGKIPTDLLAWHDGLTDWVSVATVLTPRGSAATLPPQIAGLPSKASQQVEKTSIITTRRVSLPFVACFIVVGLSFCSGLVVGLSSGLAVSSKAHGDVFEVSGLADTPDTAWWGHLHRADGTDTDVIIDFGLFSNFAKGDELEGVFVPTEEVGRWASSPYRIYKVKGPIQQVHSLE